MSERPGSQLTALLQALGAGRAKADLWEEPVPNAHAGLTVAGLSHRSGHPVAVTRTIEALVASLGREEQGQVVAPLRAGGPQPVRFGDAPARQLDARTCGAASIAMAIATGDPAVAAWLVTGEDPAHVMDTRYAGITALLDRHAGDPGLRWASLQRAIFAVTRHRGPLATWPAAWGTPPWGAARLVNWGQVRYESHLVNDLDSARLERTLAAVFSAAANDIPSLLYVGGDSKAGMAAAVPRHVVVASAPAVVADGPRGPVRVVLPPRADPELVIYEPSGGVATTVARSQLAGTGIAAQVVGGAFGGWNHLTWAVTPRRETRWW